MHVEARRESEYEERGGGALHRQTHGVKCWGVGLSRQSEAAGDLEAAPTSWWMNFLRGWEVLV